MARDRPPQSTTEIVDVDGGGGRSRVWSSPGGFSYPSRRFGGADLYHFAWAQAVQNKPLGLDKMMGSKDEDDDDEEFEIEDFLPEKLEEEKEEGEIEEGEIDLKAKNAASETNEISMEEKNIELKVKGVANDEIVENDDGDGGEEVEEDIEDLDKQVGLILEELEAVTEEEVEKSFEDVCTRLRRSFENLKGMVSLSERAPVFDALVCQAFVGIQTVHAVVSSSGSKNTEQNKDFLLRLLIHIKNQYHLLLSEDQLEEIDAMVKSLVFKETHTDLVKASSMDETNSSARESEKSDFSSMTFSSERSCIQSRALDSGFPKLEVPIVSRVKPEFSPLLDLHAAYDESSLPSPTRDNVPPLPIQRPTGIGLGNAISVQPISLKNTVTEIRLGNEKSTQPEALKTVTAEDALLHPYVTDPFKAVSSYQQKYGRTSSFTLERLPSPTPSEEGNAEDNDLHGEVSSSLGVCSSSTFERKTYQMVGSSSSGSYVNKMSAQQQSSVKTALPSTLKASAKSRDPRLKFMNSEAAASPSLSMTATLLSASVPKDGPSEAMSSRKHKTDVVNDHMRKRHRIGVGDSVTLEIASGKGGWLEDDIATAHQPGKEKLKPEIIRPVNGNVSWISFDRRPDTNTNFNVIQHNPSRATTAVSSFAPSVLKDVSAVNPTMLMQLIQQKLAAENQQKVSATMQIAPTLSDNKVRGGAPLVAGFSSKPLELGQNPGVPQATASVGVLQPTAQPYVLNQQNLQNEAGKLRMKPRDPRRVLHGNMPQKGDLLGSGQAKINGATSLDTRTRDNLVHQEQADKAQTSAIPSQSVPQSNNAPQSTKNVVDAMAAPQMSAASSAAPRASVRSGPIMTDSKMDVRPFTFEPNNQKYASGPASAAGTCGALDSPNPWGDVDHLLDGYDEQQKAAIQRERARRIEEQNKMFAARKLCLVLDLDHTLLNSAKFTEVDPIHDEILRKKEELDREKVQRHLFRFPHMGMWTKLRPGIWNFLERASKLYELHVYTMGNKLYATEMAKILDPTGSLFAGRVISRGDDNDLVDGDERVPKSKDLDGVLGMESAVVIIDDSVKVWPHHKPNLIVVERYTFFPCSRRQFGLPGPSLLEIDHDERPEDGTLASSLAVIEKIHQNFFSHCNLNEVDVRNILAVEQQKILGRCRIVFSRIFPVGEANPHLHPLWQTAEQFGATCTNQIDERVTHVVANSLGTDKVNWALSTGRFVVHPSWMEASALLYRRANELDFAVKQ